MRGERKADKRPQVGVFREAWENMSADLSRLLPKGLRKKGQGRRLLLLGAIVDLVILGAVGKFVYDWLTG